VATTVVNPPHPHPTLLKDSTTSQYTPTYTHYLDISLTVISIPRTSSIFLTRYCFGLQSGSNRNGLHLARKNFQSAVDHPEIVEDYLHDELSLGRISGPYSPSMCPDVHINRFGVIPKNHQQNKLILISDLSHQECK